MIETRLSEMWAAMAPALANHVWQSTLFAVAAGLLTLLLRKNYARARYWLWLAASLKFLIPFSLLVALGSGLAGSRGPTGAGTGLYFAMEQISQPFTPATTPAVSRVVAPATMSSSLIHLLPFLLAGVWLCGFVVVLLAWYLRWRRIAAVTREALPLAGGREVEALRRLERRGSVQKPQKPLEMRLSPASLEPGIFGIARPILIWPEGISQHLEDAHLEAILAHELWHVRRRDNLAATIHMAVEAVFWFHPLVWWLGERLVEERERACDEGVLQLGSPRNVYAQSILNVCQFCVGSPLACVSGVTGADLKKRITRIMTERVASRLGFPRMLLLAGIALMAVTAPVVYGLLHPAQSQAAPQTQSATAPAPAFDVVSIKPVRSDSGGVIATRLMMTPDSLTATNVTLRMLIKMAYGIEDHQISGAPGWLDSDKYNLEAKIDQPVVEALRKLNQDDQKIARQNMMQAVLVDRFHLKIHRDSKELPIYALVVAKNGPKLHEAKPGDTYPNGLKGPDGVGRAGVMRMGRGEVTAQGLPMSSITGLLSRQLGRTVQDKTGLTGNYDFTLHWTPEEGEAPMLRDPAGGPQGASGAVPPDASGPSIFTAIQEQLGLKLESQKGPVEMIVIDHVEKPSEN